MYKIRGFVKDKDGNAIARNVFVYLRDSGEFVDKTVSNVFDGSYEFLVGALTRYLVVVQPNEGDKSNAVMDNILPIPVDIPSTSINNIGVSGTIGFGVGICPETPQNIIPLHGTFDTNSPDYGNYEVSIDGSIVVWIPAFYYRFGTTEETKRAFEVKPFSEFDSIDAANLAGWALPRAFYDGGQLKSGFFIDKYRNTISSSMTPCSIKHGRLLGGSISYTAFYPTATTAGEIYNIPSLRGEKFGLMSVFQSQALWILAMASIYGSASYLTCAWKSVNSPFPRGFNLSPASDRLESTFQGYFDIYSSTRALAGSGYPFAKMTHNGQENGVSDLYSTVPGTSAESKEIISGISTMPGWTSIIKKDVENCKLRYNKGLAGFYDVNLAYSNWNLLASAILKNSTLESPAHGLDYVSTKNSGYPFNFSVDENSEDYYSLHTGFTNRINDTVISNSINYNANDFQWLLSQKNGKNSYISSAQIFCIGSAYKHGLLSRITYPMTHTSALPNMRCSMYI